MFYYSILYSLFIPLLLASTACKISVLTESLSKFSKSLYIISDDTLAKSAFITATVILRKAESPVSTKLELLKDFGNYGLESNQCTLSYWISCSIFATLSDRICNICISSRCLSLKFS